MNWNSSPGASDPKLGTSSRHQTTHSVPEIDLVPDTEREAKCGPGTNVSSEDGVPEPISYQKTIRPNDTQVRRNGDCGHMTQNHHPQMTPCLPLSLVVGTKAKIVRLWSLQPPSLPILFLASSPTLPHKSPLATHTHTHTHPHAHAHTQTTPYHT